EPVEAGAVTVCDGQVTQVPGDSVLDGQEVNAVYNELTKLAVPVDESTPGQPRGVNHAFVDTTALQHDEDADTITDTAPGEVYTVGTVGDEEYFVDADGQRAFSQGWLQSVGWSNYERLFTDPNVGGQFAAAFVWTLVFAAGSVLATFVLGLDRK